MKKKIIKTKDEIKQISLNDVLEKKISLSVLETDFLTGNCNFLTDDVCEIIKFFNFEFDILTTYRTDAYFEQTNKFKTILNSDFLEILKKYSKSINSWSYTSIPGISKQYKQIKSPYFYGVNILTYKDSVVYALDELVTCSSLFEKGKENSYPIYKVLEIMNKRRIAANKKETANKCKTFELKIQFMGLCGELVEHGLIFNTQESSVQNIVRKNYAFSQNGTSIYVERNESFDNNLFSIRHYNFNFNGLTKTQMINILTSLQDNGVTV